MYYLLSSKKKLLDQYFVRKILQILPIIVQFCTLQLLLIAQKLLYSTFSNCIWLSNNISKMQRITAALNQQIHGNELGLWFVPLDFNIFLLLNSSFDKTEFNVMMNLLS